MSALQEWLKLAPKPADLRQGQKWHVFLSYRSLHRRWVIHLYDILRQLGYTVFLDQYVLSASDRLVLKLSEALGSSQSGVLIWSSATEDSKWCQDEFAAMVGRENAGDDFRFVVATLDSVKLPALAGIKLYQDFSGCPEGPCGSALLRIIYGLQGQPLSADAIKFSESVDEDFRTSLNAVRAAVQTGNADRLIQLASSATLAWKSSAMLCCGAAEGLISLKRYADALKILDAVAVDFPLSIRPKQLRGLALRRLGHLKAAQEVLSELAAAGELDPETMGILAATWMERFLAEGNRLHLQRSRDLYVQAFLNTPKDYYVGINAASKCVLLGEIEKAKTLADQVEKIVGSDPKPGNYWLTATIAEVQLIRGNFANAATIYGSAVAMEPDSRGSHESTWKQAQLLMDQLKPTAEERAAVGAAFKHLTPDNAGGI